MVPTRRLSIAPALLAAALATVGCSNEAAESQDAEPEPEETRAPLKLEAQYKAFLYGPDHGADSTFDQAWQVIREDRVNVHERGVRQDADEDDPVFGDAANRDRIEAMVANGNLTEESARKIVDGNVLVAIDVYSRDGEPTRLDVSVY